MAFAGRAGHRPCRDRGRTSCRGTRERALRIRHSFATVAEAFIADKLAKERSGKVAERDLRNTFIAAWAERPVSDITKTDVLEIINSKKRSAPKMAGALLVLIRRFFSWAIDQQIYGLSASPCDRLSVVKLVGPMSARDRRLSDIELSAFWRATGRMKYPAGPLYRLLLLTGLRLNECARLSWPEVQGDTLVIPAARMKGKPGRAREHLVPLSSAAKEIIASLPRYRDARFLFSFNAGKRPLTMTGPIKHDLDRRMLRTLKAMARRRSEDHHQVKMENWTNHDLRRVVRTVCRNSASRTTSPKLYSDTDRPASSAYTTFINMRTRSARRWSYGRNTSRRSATRRLRLPRSSSCWAAAMTKVSFFTYTIEQRNEIRAVVRNAGLDVDQSLWSRIEIAAKGHILCSALESTDTGTEGAHQRDWKKLRDKVEALRP